MPEKIQIGTTDLVVNPIGLGTNAVGGHNLYPDLDEEAGRDLIRRAIDGGIDFFDTAYFYGPERSEELIGEVIKERKNRSKVILATKGAHDLSSGEITFNNRPEFLKKAVEGSLKRLQTDYIDLYYIHFPDEDTPKDESVGALEDLKNEGKIRAIGVSNFSIEQLEQANKDQGVEVYQGHYNLLTRDMEADILPFCQRQNISFIPYFPLAMGILAGKYDRTTTFPDGDLRNKKPEFLGETFHKNLDKVDHLREIADRYSTEVPHLVLAWYLTQPAIDVLIPGAKRPEQALRNLKTLDVQLQKDDIETIDRLFRA